MKKPLILTIIILLGVGGFLLYNHFDAQKSVTAWDLVPEETVLVYENGLCAKCTEQIKNSPVSRLIKNAAFLNSESDSLRMFQELATSFQEPTLVSLHITKKDEFDFTYYIKSTPSFLQKLNLTIESAAKTQGGKMTQREFNSITIHELQLKKSVFSWIGLDDVWVGSFSPVLIEDVIRTYNGKNRTFKTILGNVYHLHNVKNDGGNLFINLANLTQWLSIFAKPSNNAVLNNFGNAALLDAKISDDKIILNGFSGKSEQGKFLSAFSDQSPVSFSLRNIISNRSLIVSGYGISNAPAFFSQLSGNLKNPATDSLLMLMKDINVEPAALYEKFSGELAMCWLESRSETLIPVLILKDNEIKKWTDLFRKVSETRVADSLFVDTFSTYQIFELPANRFVERLFYPLVSGSNFNYYVQVGNTICFAEDIEELKNFLIDIDQENTWGKSVAQNKFFESTLLEANISLFVNTPKIWNFLENSLQPKWRSYIKNNQQLIRSLGMGAIQFSHLNENFYTNVSWSLEESKVVEPVSKDRFMTNFDAGIARMALVESHLDKTKEVLLQDSSFNVSLLSADGKVLWKLPFQNFIQGKVHQIDYLANGKLQYFFCTPGQMHLIDRLGNYVKPYPLSIPEERIEFVSLVDYDRSKKYRFLLASQEGNLWIYDKEGNNLEGWQPKRVEGGLIAPPQHHRLSGKDYMVAIRKDGVVILLNRRGELIPNFPLELKVRLSGDYFIERGKSQAETLFVVVSSDGTRIKFNLQGKVVAREVLVKRALDAKFSLRAEQDAKSYIILRQESSQFTVLDDKLNEIIKSDFIGNSKTDVSFNLFGNGRNYITITDKNQELSFIYDRSGKLITALPIDSNLIDIQPLENGKLKVYSAVDNAFKVSFIP